MNTETVAMAVKQYVNWAAVFSIISHLGTDLNEIMHRSDKGALIELSIDTFSFGKVSRQNLPGCDHIIPDLGNVRLEVKYQRGSLFTKTGKPKQHTSVIPLKNPMGGGQARTLDRTFDYILLLDDFAAAIAPFDVVFTHAHETRDQIIAKIPTSELMFIHTPSDFGPVPPQDTCTKFITMKMRSQYEYINQFTDSSLCSREK